MYELKPFKKKILLKKPVFPVGSTTLKLHDSLKIALDTSMHYLYCIYSFFPIVPVGICKMFVNRRVFLTK